MRHLAASSSCSSPSCRSRSATRRSPTALAAADARHSGIASGINNAVARVAGLLAVAVLPVIAGLTGESFYDPVAMADGFHVAMVACAVLAAAGGLLAFLTISSEVLEAVPATDGETPDRAATDHSCAVAGTPLRPAREARCTPIAAAGSPRSVPIEAAGKQR